MKQFSISFPFTMLIACLGDCTPGKLNLNWGVDAPGLIKKSKQIVK
jgi:hypothetical protein